MDKALSKIQDSIEQTLAASEPQLDVLAIERSGPEGLRLFIDHPDGVDLGLCERVTRELGELLSEYSLEVSSPGPERPLSRPDHFREQIGERVRVKTDREITGQRSFTGVLAAAADDAVTVETADGPVEIPLEAVRRSNLVPDSSLPSSKTEAAA